MALILNIDTATDKASVALCHNGNVIGIKQNNVQKEHASFVHVAIKALLDENGISMSQLDAVAITSGPGSYTGLRVSMAAAKGLCFALQKPLIAINTLEVMALAAKQHITANNLPANNNTILVPMIDARRTEVFTADYSYNLDLLNTPVCKALTEEALRDWLKNESVYFFGSGSFKILDMQQNFYGLLYVDSTASHLGLRSYEYYTSSLFADMVYVEPEYFKNFYTVTKK